VSRVAILEVLCVFAIAFVPWPDMLPVALPLLVVACVSRWGRKLSWADVVRTRPRRALVAGLACGLVASASALVLYRAFQVSALEWWLVPAVRGEGGQLMFALAISIAAAAASELALRGWIVERMFELSPGPAALPIATAALAEAMVWPGPIAARIGIGMFGAGLGLLHVACGRNVLAPIAARCMFAIAAVAAVRLG